MKKILYTLIIILVCFGITDLQAGNPDRQGEAGAGELLFNPWARSAGLHSMTTSSVQGIDAMRINVAGLGRIEGTEFQLGTSRLYDGALNFNAFGFAKRVGQNGAFGVSLAAIDFGEIEITTTNQPGGNGGVYSPSFMHMGLGYSYTYENKISVGVLFRGVFESITDVSASGFALDAGVQYVTGDNDEFKLGISLRNIGGTLQFSGEGLSTQVLLSGADGPLTLDQRASKFELPSMLNIGMSYDIVLVEEIILRGIANFTSNAFSRDEIGAGVEILYKELVGFRIGYKKEVGNAAGAEDNVYTGLAGGISLNLPINRDSGQRVGIDYAYRSTNPFKGTHNLSLRFSL